MKNVHVVLPDLLLPTEFAAEVCADLELPALTKLLARGKKQFSPRTASIEDCLCGAFGYDNQPLAELSAQYDGLPSGRWLRADPVNLTLQRDRLCLGILPVQAAEADEFCRHLNDYFSERGLTFTAPHPQRWYLKLDQLPALTTTPLAHVIGENIRHALPTGIDAAYWHQLFNEIQMLLYAHPANAQRELQGLAAINSVWFWGEGELVDGVSHYTAVSADTQLGDMFATAARIPFSPWKTQWDQSSSLLIYTALQRAVQQGDFATWRSTILAFEQGYAQPLWQALCRGDLAQLTLDIVGTERATQIKLTRWDTLAIWRQETALFKNT